jgi:hypothetical protein
MQRSGISQPSSKDMAERTPPRRARAPANARKRADVAHYITEITSELSKMAGDADMPMLVYFLNLARVEAETIARTTDPVTSSPTP